MKKSTLLFYILLFTLCGPSEEDIQIRIDQAKTLSVATKGGSVNPLNELYTTPGIAKALEGTSLSFDKAGMLGQLYQN